MSGLSPLKTPCLSTFPPTDLRKPSQRRCLGLAAALLARENRSQITQSTILIQSCQVSFSERFHMFRLRYRTSPWEYVELPNTSARVTLESSPVCEVTSSFHFSSDWSFALSWAPTKVVSSR